MQKRSNLLEAGLLATSAMGISEEEIFDFLPDPKRDSIKLEQAMYQQARRGAFVPGKVKNKQQQRLKTLGLMNSVDTVTKQAIRRDVVGRNDQCPCESGKKFKRCCIGRGV